MLQSSRDMNTPAIPEADRRKLVVTYRAIYEGGTVTLCDQHEDTADVTLGEVQHGAHRGYCDVCEGDISEVPR